MNFLEASWRHLGGILEASWKLLEASGGSSKKKVRGRQAGSGGGVGSGEYEGNPQYLWYL